MPHTCHKHRTRSSKLTTGPPNPPHSRNMLAVDSLRIQDKFCRERYARIEKVKENVPSLSSLRLNPLRYEEYMSGIPIKIRLFHGPLRQYGLLSFQTKNSGRLRTSIAAEKFPMDGSEGLFYDVSCTFLPFLTSVLLMIFLSR
jgi:hypothetical protein